MSEVNPELIVKTQKILGKYVKKPALTEKLLNKPPFRFLHDIIKVLIKDTGFLKGLFTADELNSENVKDKAAKVAFLEKLINAVKSVTNTELKVRPSKIVAGLEPAETNILLQTIGTAIDKKVSTNEYVGKLSKNEKIEKTKIQRASKSKNDGETKKTTGKDSTSKGNTKTKESGTTSNKKLKSFDTTAKAADHLSKESVKTNDKQSKNRDEKIKSHSHPENGSENDKKRKKGENGTARKEAVVENISNIDNLVEIEEKSSNNIRNEEKNTETNQAEASKKPKGNIEDCSNLKQVDTASTTTNNGPLTRPKSAKPKSSALKSRSGSTQDQINEQQQFNEIQILGHNNNNKRPPSSSSSLLRPPSVRPSSARPGAPRLRQENTIVLNEPMQMGNINVIVENFNGNNKNNKHEDDDDDETVVIQNVPELNDDAGIISSDLLNSSGPDGDGANKGQLVEEILEQIQQHDTDGVKKAVEIDWEQDALRGKDAVTKEVTQLRNQIQSLTKSVNPLGKLMNYLHEDVDAMHSEYRMWANTKKQLYLDIEKQKKANIESTKPLLIKLEQLKEEKKKYEQEIITLRSNILRNDIRIKELLLAKSK